MHLPPDAVRDHADEVLPDKKESIVVYGSDESCPGCAAAVDALEALGYEDVTWFRAGKREWKREGYMIEAEGR
ncbi:MAG: hypothetical protein KY397_01385 [Gemmatimonadetes bacterium]|nr:hypothetical protein [Gemmatimonadota bacterium]